MKVLIFILLLGLICCYADDTSDITNTIVEGKGGIAPYGKVSFKYREETIYRGKTKLMEVESRENARGEMIITGRGYFIGDDLIMGEHDETDKDGNDNMGGRLENISFLRLGTNLESSELEMFTRQPDGSVKPVSTQFLRDQKMQMVAGARFMEMMETNIINDIKSVVVSPDKTFKAIVFERDCGALCSFNRQIIIIRNSEELSKYDPPGNFFYAENKEGAKIDLFPKIQVTWLSTNELHIKYPNALEVTTNSPNQPIIITYEKFAAK